MTSSIENLFHLVGRWLTPLFTPDLNWEYGWLAFITIPLTMVGLLLASRESRQFCNDLAVTTVFGGLALAVLLMFVAPFLTVVMVIIGLVSSVIGLSLNLSLKGIFSAIWTIIKLLPFFFVVWLITKIPGLQGLIERWVGMGKAISSKIWSQREAARQNPNIGWAAVGAALLALLLSSQFAAHLTDFAAPGLIPGVAATFGLGIFIYRTTLGNKLSEAKFVSKSEKVEMKKVEGAPLYDVAAWKKRGERKPLLDADGNQRYGRAKPGTSGRFPWEDEDELDVEFEAKYWKCSATKLAFTRDGKRIPLCDDNGQVVLREGRPVQLEEPCGEWNANEAIYCQTCGTLKAEAELEAEALAELELDAELETSK